ncbi:ABC transporter permease [Smaragdicoccus niigatensis]|uniref:ABC transporter permease n=1 Tax=Smaragdicoccus niigatensis TaxID=359359 RepID=UPI0003805381|nr:ABC transporter permease [Smaragdicoccus niigatensis]
MNRQPQPWIIVATREIHVRLTNRAFVVSTLITMLLIAGGAAFGVWQSSKESTHTIVVSDQSAEALVTSASKIAHTADDTVTIEVDRVSSDVAAKAAVDDGKADAWLYNGPSGWTLSSDDQVDLTVKTAVEQSVRMSVLDANAAAAGTSVQDLMKGADLKVDRLDGKQDNSGAIKLITFAFAILFFMAAMMFGIQIAQSVVEEKQSRLVEIIATAIPLRHLLSGKVVGNAVLALAQVVLYSATGLVALSFTDLSGLLPGLSWAVAWFIAFFAIGFLALACLYAVAGALASRNEDIQTTTAPMTYALMAVYLASFGLSGNALVIVSYVPIASVIAMPARLLAGDVAWWEPVLSLGITGLFAAGVIYVGERAYRHSLMQTGGKLSWRKALAPVG